MIVKYFNNPSRDKDFAGRYIYRDRSICRYVVYRIIFSFIPDDKIKIKF